MCGFFFKNRLLFLCVPNLHTWLVLALLDHVVLPSLGYDLRAILSEALFLETDAFPLPIRLVFLKQHVKIKPLLTKDVIFPLTVERKTGENRTVEWEGLNRPSVEGR